ncbi:MAG: hypothetical protein ABI599_02830 [Flavobacteriales bacterium]
MSYGMLLICAVSTIAYTNSARYWATDTLDPGAEDSLRLVLEDTVSTGDRMALLLYHLHSGNWTELQSMLQADWYLEGKHAALRDYVGAIRNVYGDVSQLSSTEMQAFEVIANSGDASAGLCWGALLQRDYWRELPELPILSGWKRDELTQEEHRNDALVDLHVQPNPAVGNVWVTTDTDSGADQLLVYGPFGDLILSRPLAGTNGLIELNTTGWVAGLYLLRATVESIPVAEIKLTIAGSMH